MKDIESEKKEKEEIKKTEEKQVSWFQRVPSLYKLVGLGIIFIRYMSIVNNEGEISELWIWVVAVILFWYFIGTDNRRRDSEILTPQEAIESMEKEIAWMRKTGRIDRWSKIYVGPYIGLFHHEGMPQHYQISIEKVDDKGGREYFRGIVNAEGDTKGYATLQIHEGKLTGKEAIPIISPIPRWLKRSQKFDLDLDKYIFGDKK